MSLEGLGLARVSCSLWQETPLAVIEISLQLYVSYNICQVGIEYAENLSTYTCSTPSLKLPTVRLNSIE